MTFQHASWLWWLLLLLPLALVEWRAVGRARGAMLSLLGRQPLPGLLAQIRPGRRELALGLRLAAMLLLGLGAAGPQWGREAVRRQSQGSDLVFVVDVSSSMEARDVPPSRMEEARREAVALLERLEGSRIGVVAFAGDAVRLCPLTLDHAAVRLTLETLGPGTVSEPGSDLGRALRAGLKLLQPGRREEQAMVVWTDGEDLEGHAREVLQELHSSGLRVHVVGVGTAAGDVIPLVDVAGVTLDVKRDENGEVVRSRLDEPLLREVARATGGQYFSAARSGGEVVRLSRSLGSLARSRHGTRLVERPVARFPLFSLVAAACLVTLLATPSRRRAARAVSLGAAREARAAKRRRTAGATFAGAMAALLLVALPRAVSAQSDWARGDQAFKRKDWARAESLYARRARQARPAPGVLANLATARANQSHADSVERDLASLTSRDDPAGRMAGYNLGTLLGRRGELNSALAELRRAIERDPDDADARWNYEWLQGQKQQQAKKPDQKGGGEQPEQRDPKQGQRDPGQGAPQPQQPQGDPAQSRSTPAPAPDVPGMQQPMTREQAEQLLGSLGDLERIERQDKRRSQMRREKQGKDW